MSSRYAAPHPRTAISAKKPHPSQPAPHTNGAPAGTPLFLQRAQAAPTPALDEKKEEELRQRGLTQGATPEPCEECEEERVMRKAGGGGEGAQSPGLPSAVAKAHSSAGDALDGRTRERMEKRFGVDFQTVRVHADGQAASAARDVHALAFTMGRDIYFEAGQFAPTTHAGQRLIAHELAHVIQQSSHGSRADGQRMDRGPSDPLEQQAEASAVRAMADSAPEHSAAAPLGAPAALSIQRYAVPRELACLEVVPWLNSNSPYAPEWAETRCTYSFNGGLRTSSTTNPDGTVTVRARGTPRSTVAVSCPVDRPSWNPSARANRAAEVAAWQAMRVDLDAHEAEHKRIGRDWRVQLEQRFQAVDFTVTGTDATDAQTQAGARAQSDQQTWMADAQAAQDAIDPFRGANLACP